MANISYYEDLIRDLDVRCQQSIVCIRIYSDGNRNRLLSVGTGIVIASEDGSCFIMTSGDFIRNHGERNTRKVGDFEFFDGTVHQLDWRRCNTHMEIGILSVPIHGEIVKFSASEAMEGQKVFTIGYNYDKPNKRYISGNIVCGANIIDKKATQFVHGCSTGKHGHQGSAMFNEEGQLVGMNFFYTRSRTINHPNNEPDIGGLVSALDLNTIKRRLQYMCFKAEDKSLDEALEHLRSILRRIQG